MSTAHHTHHRRSLSISSIASQLSHPSKSTLHALIIPFLILGGIVISSATQTEVAHHLSVDVGYNKPYFTFFLTHITFSFVFPVHLLLLKLFRPKVPLNTYLDGICEVVSGQLGSTNSWAAVGRPWSIKMSWLTLLISVPALCWFVAMQYSPAMDITAIYATSSFHAYFFSMLLLKQPLSKITGGSIALAFAGVIVLSLAGDDGASAPVEGAPAGVQREESSQGRRFLGDGIMMFGLYEVVYKLTLPEGHGGVASSQAALYDPIQDVDNEEVRIGAEEYGWEPPDSRSESPKPLSNVAPGGSHRPSKPRENIALSPKRDVIPIDRKTSSSPLLPASSTPAPAALSNSLEEAPIENGHYHSSPHHSTPPLPAALHANFITSCIGVATCALLWVPIPLLHYLGWEQFVFPSSTPNISFAGMWISLEVIAWSGAAYNAGLMVLIGVWGPTTSSVANLLTIGLVAIIDAVLMGHLPGLQTVIGVGMICIGFGILLWEGEG